VTISGKRAVDALEPRDKPYIVFDGHLPGFGVRVMPSGLKTFILDYRPGAGGRSVTKRRLTLGRYGPMTAEQARKAALDALAHIRLGADPHAEKTGQRAALTVAGLIGAFLEDHGAKLKAKTRAHYSGALTRLGAAHGNLKAEALTRAQVAAVHAAMSGTPYQANRMLAAVSSLYSWAERHGHLPEGHSNPARKIRRYREEGRERFLTGEELSRLGDALRLNETLDPFPIAAVRLLILTGARLGEILSAKWEQVDFERGILNLADSKTGRKPVYLSAAALEVLAGLPRLEGNPHLIPGMKQGAPRFDLKKPWTAITKAAGLDGLRIHDLRHSFASVGAGASLGLPVIGRLLGHTQAATTQRYAHLSDDPMRRAVETIGATISAAMGRKGPAAPTPLRGHK
jgi:integrase